MIPYDDLVVALQTWRARQGLPVAGLSGFSGITVPPAAVAAPEPPRTNPPAPPPKAAVPPPLAPVETRDEDLDEEAALIEEGHYENEGDDFAMAFSAAVNEEGADEVESTSIGTPPAPTAGPRDSFGGTTQPEPGPSGIGPGKLNNDDW